MIFEDRTKDAKLIDLGAQYLQACVAKDDVACARLLEELGGQNDYVRAMFLVMETAAGMVYGTTGDVKLLHHGIQRALAASGF